jgi:hypothetical protein
LADSFLEKAASVFAATGEKQRLFGDLFYVAETRYKERRVLVTAKHVSKGSNPRHVVTNLAGAAQ